jgi:hypothetical protein
MKNPLQQRNLSDNTSFGLNGFELRYENVDSRSFEVEIHSIELIHDPYAEKICRHYKGNHFYQSGLYEKRMAELFKGEGSSAGRVRQNSSNEADEIYNSLRK